MSKPKIVNLKSTQQSTQDKEILDSNKTENKIDKNMEPNQQKEYGGCKGPEPTRYGDWELKGRCIDF